MVRNIPAAQRSPLPHGVDATARSVVDSALMVHRELGPGLLQFVYETCLCHEPTTRGLSVQRQQALPVEYDGIRLDARLRLDLLVDGHVVVELKTVERLLPIDTAQALTHLKLTGHRLALVTNRNVARIKDGILRVTL
jgi:GxxExxY protein